MKRLKQDKRGINGWLVAVAVVLVLFLLINVVAYVWMPFLPWTEERDAGENTIEQTYDADQAIQTYEEFRRLHEDIQTKREQIANAYDELDRFYDVQGEDPDAWSRQAETRWNRIQERITGQQQILEELIGEYNAMTRSANQELFKCHLPYQVDDRLEIRGPPGSGDAEQAVQDVGPDGEPVDPSADVPEPENCDGLPDEIQRAAQEGDN